MDENEDNRDYDVVINHEGEYSLWLAGRALPEGWMAAGRTGKKAECLAYIAEVWKEVRPRSLRLRLEAQKSSPGKG